MTLKTIEELEQETDSIHFYDKITKRVVLIHTHCLRDEARPEGFAPTNSTQTEVDMIVDQIVPGGAYEFILDKLTDNDINNLGYVLDKKLQRTNSFLEVDTSGQDPVLAPKYYLDLSLTGPGTAVLLNDDGARKRQLWSFDADGVTPLEFKVECRRPADTQCKRCPETSTKITDKTHQVKVEVSHGKLVPKDGVYDLVNGEATNIQWILPDESIEDAKIWVRDFSTDFLNSNFRTSNTLKVRCY